MQENPIDKKIIVVGRRSSKKKYLLVLLILFLILSALIFYALSLPQNDNIVDVRPSSIPTPTIEVGVSPTIIEEFTTPTPKPTNTDVSLQKYIFPDCEIELLADSQWIPSSSGSLGTCGILSTTVVGDFSNLTDFEGTLIAILPFLSDSPFAPEKQNNYEEYLDRMNKDTNRYTPTKDFLYSREDYQVDYRPAIIAEIYNAELGMTKQIFYTAFRGEYIILWGGQTSESMEEDVMNVLSSIKFRQSLPGED